MGYKTFLARMKFPWMHPCVIAHPTKTLWVDFRGYKNLWGGGSVGSEVLSTSPSRNEDLTRNDTWKLDWEEDGRCDDHFRHFINQKCIIWKISFLMIDCLKVGRMENRRRYTVGR
jgi:hypothetical protein